MHVYNGTALGDNTARTFKRVYCTQSVGRDRDMRTWWLEDLGGRQWPACGGDPIQGPTDGSANRVHVNEKRVVAVICVELDVRDLRRLVLSAPTHQGSCLNVGERGGGARGTERTIGEGAWFMDVTRDGTRTGTGRQEKHNEYSAEDAPADVCQPNTQVTHPTRTVTDRSART